MESEKIETGKKNLSPKENLFQKELFSRKELLDFGIMQLTEAGIEEASLDAWYLLEKYGQFSRMQYYMEPDKRVDAETEVEYQKAVEKRKSHIPLQYITGEQEFMGLSFLVTPDVLIPRQDTELLVEEVLPYVEGKRILDICTGSGCILLSLAKLGKPSYMAGTDISGAALAVARENAERLGCKVEFQKADLFQGIPKEEYDLIVSNPPYIEPGEIETLAPEVREHEPGLALYGGEDGLLFYRRIVEEAGKWLVPGGRIFFEIGYNQGKSVPEILKKAGYTEIKVKKDYAGLDRVVGAVWP